MMFASALRKVGYLALIVSMSVLIGVLAAQGRFFPYPLILEGQRALSDVRLWIELWARGEAREEQVHLIESRRSALGESVRYDQESAYEGVTLMSRFSDDRMRVSLVEMDGTLAHEWVVPDEVYKAAGAKLLPLKKSQYEIMGMHLFPNGDLIFIISYRVMAKVDRCSQVQWLFDGSPHHDLTVLPNGNIWVASGRKHFTPYSTSQALSEEFLVLLSPDGQEIDRFSVLDSFMQTDYKGVLLQGPEPKPDLPYQDVTHLNDIDVVDRAFARRHSFAEPGDLLISLRTVDSVALIDRETRRVKWALTGMFLRQHDPDLLPDGSMLVFDNRTERAQYNGARHITDEPRFGFSRVVQLDPATQEVIWQYEGTREHPFYTSIQGSQQPLPNGNVLIVDTEGGRVFEVEKKTGRIVWEFRNVVSEEGDRVFLGRITDAVRYSRSYTQFLGQPCS